MLSSVEQAFVGRDEKQAPLKTPAWEATAVRVGFELKASGLQGECSRQDITTSLK